MLQHAPPVAAAGPDPEAEQAIAALQDVVRGVRSFRADNDIAPREPLKVAVEISAGRAVPSAALAALARCEHVSAPAEAAQVQPIAGGRLMIEREGGIDTAAEIARLEDAVALAEKELARAEKQLANERFVERAPADLVAAEREKAERFRAEAETLGGQLAALRSDA